jgi:hyperosmotically inducible periplasmic protein
MKTKLVLGVFATLAFAIGCAQSDAGITAKVKSKFAADKTVEAHEINVDTKNKIVTLTGTVDTQAAKDRALDIARSTEGVTDVVDNLSIKVGDVASSATLSQSAAQAVDDATITTKVKAKLLADSVVGGLKIDVDTHDGVVTLSGDNIKSQAAIDQAIRLAREVEGVRDVKSNLTTRNA